MRERITDRIMRLENIQQGYAMSLTEIANRVHVDNKQAENAIRRLMDQGRLQSRIRHRNIAEYRINATASKWIKAKWLRHTGMRITREFREMEGDFVR